MKNKLLLVWRKSITIIAIVALFLSLKLANIQSVEGNQVVAARSTKEYVLVYLTINRVLKEHNAPLASEANNFSASCIRHDIDCYLLPAISGVESGFGRALMPGSHNAWGWGGGYLYFPTWRDGIDAVDKGIRTGYVSKGLTTPELIAPVYAPPSHTWAGNVRMYKNQFELVERETRKQVALMEQAGLL